MDFLLDAGRSGKVRCRPELNLIAFWTPMMSSSLRAERGDGAGLSKAKIGLANQKIEEQVTCDQDDGDDYCD